ncbi:uncharacterized protein LOC113149763 isoform X3 [Anabas testudineus]|uniref:uncharacterized protein LOC113149763 isoform X3 n=1 Tax=Anabas testudineus TaxID=64144 RepID=UPI000E45F75A|nr:uncharacterized protein LOC113149763 isoform X3 [Anabas testudineus]
MLMYENQTVNEDIDTSQLRVSVIVTFPASYLKQKQKIWRCQVTDVQTLIKYVFTFSPQSAGDDKTTVATKVMRRAPEISDKTNSNTTQPGWWLYITVAVVGSTALILTVVGIMRLKRGKRTETNENAMQHLNLVLARPVPEISPGTTDPEDEVSYASISFTRNTNSKAPTQTMRDDDGGDAVTYSTVKASYSSVVVSTDPSDLYATINKPTT